MLLGFFSSSIAGTIDPKNSDKEYLEYGNKHKCVLKIEGKDIKDKHFYASCVIIKPKIFITAAHVVENIKSSNVVFGDEKIETLIIIYPSEYKSNEIGKHDIAIGYLEKEINLDFYPPLYEKTDEVGKTCSMAGFGVYGTYLNGANFSDGNKRAGSNIIDGIFNDMLICSLKHGKKTSLEFLISHGDSGGGLFIDSKLAGINSCVLSEDGNLNSDINDESGHTRISVNKQWIDEMVEKIELAEKNVILSE